MREIDELLPNDDDVITHEIILQMTHMDAFFREVLRHGAEMLGMRKVATRDFIFSDGTVLRKGWLIDLLCTSGDGGRVREHVFVRR